MRKPVQPLTALATLLALGGCGQQAAPGNQQSMPIVEVASSNVAAAANAMNAAVPANAANTQNSAAETAAEEASVRAVIDTVYTSYEGRGANNPANYPLTPDLRVAWNRAVGTEGALDVDPYCACQDYDAGGFSHLIRSVEVKDGRAHVALTIRPFANASTTPLWYDLLKTPKGWLIDDLSDESGKSLKARFKAAAPASMAAQE